MFLVASSIEQRAQFARPLWIVFHPLLHAGLSRRTVIGMLKQ
jgi:hypothetical protein